MRSKIISKFYSLVISITIKKSLEAGAQTTTTCHNLFLSHSTSSTFPQHTETQGIFCTYTLNNTSELDLNHSHKCRLAQYVVGSSSGARSIPLTNRFQRGLQTLAKHISITTATKMRKSGVHFPRSHTKT